MVAAMATFLNNNIRAFRAPSDSSNLPLDCKSLFHLKTYPSATDCRAWAYPSEDRKQYILEMFAADSSQNKKNEVYIGKYVHIHALLKTLLSNKDSDIIYLQNQLNLLEAFLEDLPLTQVQKTNLATLKQLPGCGQVMRMAPLLTRPSSGLSMRVSEEFLPNSPNPDQLIDQLSLKLGEREAECQEQRMLAHDAVQRLAALKNIVTERDHLMRQNEKLRTTLTWLRNTKASSNNDLLMQNEIKELKQQLKEAKIVIADVSKRASSNTLSTTHAEGVSIMPTTYWHHEQERPRLQREVRCGTSENNLHELSENRNHLSATITDLLGQISKQKREHEAAQRKMVDCTKRMELELEKREYEQKERDANQHELVSELRHEIAALRARLQETDIRRLDYDRLNLKLSELQLAEMEFVDLKKKHAEKLLEEITMRNEHLHIVNAHKEQIVELRKKIDYYRSMENDKNVLANKCNQLQEIIEAQKERLRNLEHNSVNNEKIHALEDQLGQKEKKIRVSEDQIISLQKQLRESINSLENDSNMLQAKLQESESHVSNLLIEQNHQSEVFQHLRNELDEKEQLLQSYTHPNKDMIDECTTTMLWTTKTMQEKDNIIEKLRSKLLELQVENEKLTQIARKIEQFVVKKSMGGDDSAEPLMSSDFCSSSGKERIECIHNAMHQLQHDLAVARVKCDDPNFRALQERYHEVRTLARNQVQWLALELHKCKQNVQTLSMLVKSPSCPVHPQPSSSVKNTQCSVSRRAISNTYLKSYVHSACHAHSKSNVVGQMTCEEVIMHRTLDQLDYVSEAYNE